MPLSTREGAACDFAERFYTGYSSLMRVHGTDYQDRLNNVLADTQVRRNQLGGLCARFSKNSHSL